MPSKEVIEMFGRLLRNWKAALERWKKKCDPVQLERSRILARHLVADETSRRGQRGVNRPVTDVPKPGYAGLSPEMAKRLEATENLARRCENAIPELERIIGKLQEAQRSGVWSGGPQLSVALLKEPKFTVVGTPVARVSREEQVTVLELQGEWWRVRTLSGKEGWVHGSQLKPNLPVELTSGAGGSKGTTQRDEVESGPRA